MDLAIGARGARCGPDFHGPGDSLRPGALESVRRACPCLRRKRARSNVSSCAGPSASKRALISLDCRLERMRWSSSGPIVS